MKEQDLRRKVRKKAKKLARFADKHGIDYISIIADLYGGEPYIYAYGDVDGECSALVSGWVGCDHDA